MSRSITDVVTSVSVTNLYLVLYLSVKLNYFVTENNFILVQKKEGQQETMTPTEFINDILNHQNFLKSPTDYIRTSYYHQISDRSPIFEMLDKESRQCKDLPEVIAHSLKKGTACILPQNRGLLESEKGCLFWDMKKAEERLIEAYMRYCSMQLFTLTL